MRGYFISVEGPDGSGKSTQVLNIKKYLEEKGVEVLVTREPGGTNISEKIRELVLDKDNIEMESMTEALLYAASRAQHVREKIVPAVEEGKVVICDRFVHSSLVYQGVGRGLGIKEVMEINKFAIAGNMPDMVLYFDVDMEVGQKRVANRKNLDRLELEAQDFHKKIYNAYQDVIDNYSDNVVKVDANKSEIEVFSEVKKILNEFIK